MVENCENNNDNNQILINVINDKSISSHRLCGVKQLVKSVKLIPQTKMFECHTR